MKKLLLAIVVFCSFQHAIGQKTIKIDSEKFNELATIQSTIDLLNDYHGIINGLYFGTSNWIHDQTNLDGKEQLRDIIFKTYPSTLHDLEEQLHLLKLDLKSYSIDTLFSDVFQLAKNSENIMSRLVKYDDYEDSVNYMNTIMLFNSKVIPSYKKIETEYQFVFSAVQNRYNELQASLQMRTGKTTIKITDTSLQNLAIYSDNLSTMQTLKQFCWKLRFEAGAWIYVAKDTVIKADLRSNLSELPGFKQKLLRINEDSQLNSNIIELLSVAMDTLAADCEEIMNSLATDENYEDPLTYLLTCDMVYELDPHYKKTDHFIDILISTYRSDLQLVLSDPTGAGKFQKRADIIALLKNGTNIISVVNDQKTKMTTTESDVTNNAFSKIKIDDIVESLIPIYDRVFTHQEIKDILKFQKSPAGKKLRQNISEISLETLLQVRAYLKNLIQNEKARSSH